MNWENLTKELADHITQRESYQREVGKLADSVIKEYGAKALLDLTEDIKENYGLSISINTLRNYAWVHKMTFKLDLPADLSYRTLQAIASSQNSLQWAKRIKEDGLSSSEVYRLIREEKGLPLKKNKTIICDSCGKELEL